MSASALPSPGVTEHKRPSTRRTLLRLVPFVGDALPRLLSGIGVALVASLVSLAIPIVLQQLVDGPLGDGATAAGSGDLGPLIGPVTVILILGVVEAGAIALRRRMVLTPSTRIEARMRSALYSRLQDLPVSFHDRWQSGQLLSRAMSDLSLIRRWIAFGFVLLVVNALTIVVGFGVLVSWNPILGVLFVVCSIPVWIYGLAFEKRYSSIARRSQDQAGDLATTVEQSVHGIRVLKAFGRHQHALENFAGQAEKLRGTEIDKARAIAGIWLVLLLVPDIAFALCLLGGVWLAADGQLSVGELFAFFATATVLRWPVESIGFLLSMTFDTRTAVDRYFEVMDSRNTITDPEEPETIAQPRGHVRFRDVHFRYQDAPEHYPDLLDGLDLEVEPGETMAVVGITGSGKTTLTALLPRLYDVTGGAIELDGVDIRRLRRDELRTHVGMAFEDATLFSTSVRENVLLGRPEASEEELLEALEIAQADFVHRLPDGLDTTVGEEGMSLSGGQRQRLALARAVAARPAVLVLDDPLSALDVDTEARVEAGLRRVLGDTTAIIVAHRPSTVALADRVAVIEEGRITAVGTHSELLASSPHYRFVISSLEEDELTRPAGIERLGSRPATTHQETRS
ncbi:ABC transporter ATP-binding protein [Rathayibacter rathayi]|uniref:ABC transporter ATP-binding protein n=1 Tax=Rathayibacter rathayi TaxID=33887 RepID=A0ABD6W8W1_RATRA|nr:ABC transporter ATP-binding protein [Rathayibacter rathayi]AZZ50359.1 ABC transporter ATP-binding protein [Rathayibacter rathayi]MWV75450.1 ATP-binding cassette domain-containing protein [Rathayibacter rathayi NCPPB 2980 = VKM Ac-1601]PPF13748.1 ABC transporter ATP-binding protein [Rathayibacter rathayi]PPF48393.1 ABC transporter ATP-binding protein [Rathayibacter rathayi]PPG70400.1 ABC transporter ATP-binding protein [Rathayibacter rathayi]